MLPGAVYLETNILRDLPFDLQRADFLTLRELCSKYEIAVCTTKLCVDELIELRSEEFRKWMARVEDPPVWIKDHIGNPVDVKWARPKEAVLADIERAVSSTLRTQGVEVVDNVQIDQDRLLRMAVKKVPPFRDKGRGYRDAVILLTIIEHERQRQGPPGCIIVSEDPDFQGARRLPDARGLDLTVATSVQEANREVQVRMAATVRAAFEAREERLKAFLYEHRDEIQDFIRRHAPTPRYSIEAVKGLGFFEFVESIHDDTIELVEIQSAFAGFLFREGAAEGWLSLSMTARVRARATVELSPAAPASWGAEGRLDGYPNERTIEVNVVISGSVEARDDADGLPEYLGLKLRSLRWESPLSAMLKRAWEGGKG